MASNCLTRRFISALRLGSIVTKASKLKHDGSVVITITMTLHFMDILYCWSGTKRKPVERGVVQTGQGHASASRRLLFN